MSLLPRLGRHLQANLLEPLAVCNSHDRVIIHEYELMRKSIGQGGRPQESGASGSGCAAGPQPTGTQSAGSGNENESGSNDKRAKST